ncbi:MAG: PD-(D/E)XK nuclease family protein, partial [Lachnospiraceae bacterium]|nr:PD-(D/E)XK nuclease family protein [Lachnospiraceae bacterium]
ELVARTEKGKQTVPAALLYYHVSDPMIRDESGGLSEEELQEKIRQELRMTGIVNDEDAVIRMLDGTVDGKSKIIPVEYKKDGTLTARSGALDEAQILVVSDYVNRKLGELGKDIVSGVIEKKPYHYGQQTGCDYCSFKGVCGFNLRIPGYEQRDLEALSKDEALEKMR